MKEHRRTSRTNQKFEKKLTSREFAAIQSEFKKIRLSNSRNIWT
ncbi:MAG: secreted Zn-dependent insulinase-like peptidase [Saprospiraceae bacterium]|jgi:secreted Zn-dependent insulinase-like peptidase